MKCVKEEIKHPDEESKKIEKGIMTYPPIQLDNLFLFHRLRMETINAVKENAKN